MWSVRSAIVVTAIVGVAAFTPGARAANCLDAPASNGTGWRAQDNLASLPSGVTPRPGPDILYRKAPRAPQLENTAIWTAPPIMVEGASAYHDGEFLYQDFLYDDTPLTLGGC